MQKRQLELLKKEYNVAITRFHEMEKWCETASIEEQEKNFKHIVDVINTCNRLSNKIMEIDPTVSSDEILYGFKELM